MTPQQMFNAILAANESLKKLELEVYDLRERVAVLEAKRGPGRPPKEELKAA